MSYTADLKAAVQALSDWEDSCRDGGYPPIICQDVRGHILVAGVDDCRRPTLEIYQNRDLVKAWRNAKRDADDGDEITDFFMDELNTIEDPN